MTERKNSEARIKSNNKWTNAHYDRINLAVPKGRKAEIQTLAEAEGQSVNGFIIAAIDEKLARDGAEKPAGAPERDSGIPLSPPQENASQAVSAQVKAHIIKTGEDAAAFLERATESTIKRDEISLRMGINPATKAKEDLPNE